MYLRPGTVICVVIILSVLAGSTLVEVLLYHTIEIQIPPAESILLDINKASARELATLSGIGSRLARRIIALRETRQGFSHIEELLEVKGIGKHKLARMRSRIQIKSKFSAK